MADPDDLTLAPPTIADGPELYRLADASGGLDLNSPYAYLLWARDFAATSLLARRNGEGVGYVMGYRRPDEPAVWFVWQITVAPAARGLGLASRLLDEGFARAAADGARYLEATVTPSNEASKRLFGSFAERRGVPLEELPLFGGELFGDGHEPESLLRIGPVDRDRERVVDPRESAG